jgi:hypothetical protein
LLSFLQLAQWESPHIAMTSTSRLSNISIRLATEDDIRAILALLLTSFRQFPLFDFLYSPLNDNLNAAHDTVFFWRRRLLLSLFDPDVSIVVAEAPASSLAASANAMTDEEQNDPVFKQSVRAFEWTERNGLLSVSPSSEENAIVGFAIWRFRAGEKAKAGDGSKKTKASWYNRCRGNLVSSVQALRLIFLYAKTTCSLNDQPRSGFVEQSVPKKRSGADPVCCLWSGRGRIVKEVCDLYPASSF